MSRGSDLNLVFKMVEFRQTQACEGIQRVLRRNFSRWSDMRILRELLFFCLLDACCFAEDSLAVYRDQSVISVGFLFDRRS